MVFNRFERFTRISSLRLCRRYLTRVTDPSGEMDEITISVSREATLIDLLGDFDKSGVVDFSDFLEFVQAYGREEVDPEFDLNGDGSLDFSDFLIFAQNFGS